MRAAELAGLRAGAYAMGLLPDHLGQFRLAQRYWWARRPDHQILSQRLADGTRLELDLGDRTQALAYLTRRYADATISQIVGGLPRGGLFFDVGANVGLVTFQVAHRRPDVRIVAFEPNPPAVAGWERNRRLSTSRHLTLAATAITDHVGTVAFDAPSTDLGAGIVAAADRGITVPASTLDDYCAPLGIDRIDVLKLDVEGSEPEALAGARGLLESGAIRLLIVEFNDEHFERRGGSRQAMLQWLADHGMTPRGPIAADDVTFAPAGAKPIKVASD